MSSERTYPTAPAGPFPEPPLSFTDGENREIEIRSLERDTSLEALVRMYTEFDPADRAQGIPPSGEDAIRDWLELILDIGCDVVAWHRERAIGHATLVPDGEPAAELAIFVHQEYRRAGIGGNLIRGLLGYGAANGVEKVWLTVERWNHAAISLYESVGFEACDAEHFELEMVLRLR